MSAQAAHEARVSERTTAIFRTLGLGPDGELVFHGGGRSRQRIAPGRRAATEPVAYSSSLAAQPPRHARVYYKAVAVVGDDAPEGEGGARFLSIYDGTTQYRIGVDLHQPMNEDDLGETCGGFFCYANVAEVFSAIVPSSSALKHAPRAVIKCLGWGTRRRFPNGKVAVEHLRPLSIHDFPRDFLSAPPPADTTQAAPDRVHTPTRQLAAQNFALEEDVRQMEARLANARAMRGWGSAQA